jgi:hypothetical protein
MDGFNEAHNDSDRCQMRCETASSNVVPMDAAERNRSQSFCVVCL